MPDITHVTQLKPPLRHAWWKESTVYQIYPASFKSACAITSSPSDSGSHEAMIKGDLRGIISKVDYLSRLGVDMVWLSPILASPQVDMGYDISDYRAIDPMYGTMADHDELIAALHARGMKYVMDLVVNHTSKEHEWFVESRSSKSNPKRDWYYWRPPRYCQETGERMPPNNWESVFSGPAWTFDHDTGEYYLHLFAQEQPDLNWDNPSVRTAIHDMIRFWLDKGVDGFRMDVINFISKEPGLPDADKVKPGFLQPGLHRYACGPRLHEYLQGIGKILIEYHAFSVGEMPGVYDTREILKGVGQDRGELAMAFQFEIVNMDVDGSKGSKWFHRPFQPRELKAIVSKWNTFMIENGGWNAVFMENHDQGRSVSRYADESEAYRLKSAKMLAAHLGFQSGTVFVYQGQELAQIDVPREWGMDEYKDIEVLNHWKQVLRDYPDDVEMQRKFREQYRRIGRDNARTPMQWNADERTFGGFLPDDEPEPPPTGKDAKLPKDAPRDVDERKLRKKPWMRVHEDYKVWNAENQVADENSAFHYWRRVFRLRKEFKDVFVYGDFKMLDDEHECVVAYLRMDDSVSSKEDHAKKRKGLIVTNFSGKELWWTVPLMAKDLLLIEEAAGRLRLRKEAILDDLRNYVENGEKKNDVRRESDGQSSIRLRPWEVIVAMV
ncbi:hypothetical protein LTR92_006929 [Exophiala xenobiotica]|nr:hypothetical protein LTR92_006929 [Exophiala xenobiotica]